MLLLGCGPDGGATPTCSDGSGDCPCDETEAQCSSGPASSGDSSGAGSDAGGSGDGTGAGSGGHVPAFSVLPPFDVLGTEWVYEHESFPGNTTVEERCTVAELFEWPDGQPGSTWRCTQDGSPLQDRRYALYPDRVEVREVGTNVLDPPGEAFRIPVEIGDTWQIEWGIPPSTEGTDTWHAVGIERVDLPFGGFDAVALEYTTSNTAGESMSMAWWVDGIGMVRAHNDTTYHYELVSFSVP